MTLLYLGNHPPKGFEKDYHLTPLIAPDELLAQFPPILLQCGARDPLVDDTLLFADRLRKAKRDALAARVKAHRAKSGKDREPVRLPASSGDEESTRILVDREAKLREISSFSSSSSAGSTACEALDEETDKVDDVTVQIFPGWSHGYLQMMPLMYNARVAVDDIADWILSAFEREGN